MQGLLAASQYVTLKAVKNCLLIVKQVLLEVFDILVTLQSVHKLLVEVDKGRPFFIPL
jgi:hypothetical protein